MNSQELRALQEAYSQVYEQETGRGPRISDTYDMRDAEGGPKGGGTIKGPKKKNVIRKEEADLYDIILSHLLDEGYAETPEAAEAIMVNMSEDWRQDIMEISQKTATNAFATRATGEYEYDTNPSDYTKSGKSKADESKRRIEKKFGKKAGAHAERAAHARIFGRKGIGGMPSAN